MYLIFKKNSLKNYALYVFQLFICGYIFVSELIFASSLFLLIIENAEAIICEKTTLGRITYIVAENWKSFSRFIILIIIFFGWRKKTDE
jgi:hypothetical protein